MGSLHFGDQLNAGGGGGMCSAVGLRWKKTIEEEVEAVGSTFRPVTLRATRTGRGLKQNYSEEEDRAHCN